MFLHGRDIAQRIKGTRKSTPYAAQVAADDAAGKALEHGLKNTINRLSFFLGGFFLFVLLVKPLGFIFSGSLCGVGISRSFDTKISIKSFIISFLIAASVWTLFSVILSVNLGPAFSFKL